MRPFEIRRCARLRGTKNFFKKFVIGGKDAHTYKWLNLLLEPRRHLQRLGFVYLEGEKGEKGEKVRRVRRVRKNFNFFYFPSCAAQKDMVKCARL